MDINNRCIDFGQIQNSLYNLNGRESKEDRDHLNSNLFCMWNIFGLISMSNNGLGIKYIHFFLYLRKLIELGMLWRIRPDKVHVRFSKFNIM